MEPVNARVVKAVVVNAVVVKAVVTVKQVVTRVPARDAAEQPSDGEPVRRQGRPRSTSRRALEVVALRLFTERGFDETTVDQIAAAAGVGRRTFFRYFDSKTAVLWNTFDLEVDAIRRLLADSPKDLGMMDAIRGAVVAANHYHADDVPELRARMNLISSVPALQANATLHYAAWEDAIVDFAAQRCGQPADSLYPLAVGRATLAVCRAAFDRWVARADADLQIYLDAALCAMTMGFSPQAMTAEPSPSRAGTPKRTARRRH